MKHGRSIKGILILGVGLLSHDAVASIIVHWPEEPIQRPLNWTYELDVDFNGVADVVFRANQSSFWLENTGGNSVLAIPSAPPNVGAFLVPLLFGDYIGPDLTGDNEWFSSEEGGATFLSCMSVGPGQISCIGLWPPDELIGYFGLQFHIDDHIHYGWVMMDFSGVGEIVGWAYESTPETPILAGAIPEPGTLLLLTFGLSLVLLNRARRGMAP